PKKQAGRTLVREEEIPERQEDDEGDRVLLREERERIGGESARPGGERWRPAPRDERQEGQPGGEHLRSPDDGGNRLAVDRVNREEHAGQPGGRRREPERPAEPYDQGRDTGVPEDVDEVVAERALTVHGAVHGEGPGGERAVGGRRTVTRYPRGGEQQPLPRQRIAGRGVLDDRVGVVEHEAVLQAGGVDDEGEERGTRRPAHERPSVHPR